MRIIASLIVLTAALAISVPAAAQATGASSSRQRNPSTPKPAAPKPKMNVRAFGAFDVESMAASKTFDAVTGSSVMFGYGGGAEIVNLWKHLFVRGDYTTASSTGARAFAFGNDVVSTGIPITVRLGTTEIGGGWRIPMRKHLKYTPYLGGALLFVQHSEKSDFATDTENISDSATGYSVLGGVDIELQKRWYLTGEAQYRFLPNAIGATDVSKMTGETDLGGFVGRVMIGYNLKK